MLEVQFGINVGAVSSQQVFRQLVRRADALGYDVFAAPDHLGGLAPFAALSAAGMISERLRLRTYVLNTGFWNPALLAREVATLDVLSQGRAELGFGAGHMKSEHEDARLPWLPLKARVQALEEMVLEVRRRLADEAHRPQPVQQPVPLMVGAMSNPALSVAARHAEMVGFAGLRQVKGAPAGTFTVCSAAETATRVDEVRRQAGGRPYRSDVLLQRVVIGRDPEDAAAEIVASASGRLTVEQLLDTPFVLLAQDVSQAVKELLPTPRSRPHPPAHLPLHGHMDPCAPSDPSIQRHMDACAPSSPSGRRRQKGETGPTPAPSGYAWATACLM
ncbi:MAG TPA: TIGR03621 family F420-dependent LLM class oxidoreductase [Pseudonocardiaceae bacterium]|jgi:probable F420-dependent oxidoreductase|nr:TIGR03621 family F420-dependent LLM class oxidoreductase [Pseudonocardiaceae bacterium]